MFFLLAPWINLTVYIDLFNFESLFALCKWKGSNTYNLISFQSDPMIHITKSMWFLKAPVKSVNLKDTYDLWVQSVKWYYYNVIERLDVILLGTLG